MTAWTVLGSQLSPRHLWFVLGHLFLADPFILQTHWIVSVLTLTMVEYHADRSIHRHVNREVHIPGYTELLPAYDR